MEEGVGDAPGDEGGEGDGEGEEDGEIALAGGEVVEGVLDGDGLGDWNLGPGGPEVRPTWGRGLWGELLADGFDGRRDVVRLQGCRDGGEAQGEISAGGEDDELDDKPGQAAEAGGDVCLRSIAHPGADGDGGEGGGEDERVEGECEGFADDGAQSVDEVADVGAGEEIGDLRLDGGDVDGGAGGAVGDEVAEEDGEGSDGGDGEPAEGGFGEAAACGWRWGGGGGVGHEEVFERKWGAVAGKVRGRKVRGGKVRGGKVQRCKGA